MRVYSAGLVCPKCHAFLSDGHVKHKAELWTGTSLDPEHMNWACGRCGFAERFLPCDAPTKPTGPMHLEPADAVARDIPVETKPDNY